MKLQVLLVEDDSDYIALLSRSLPDVFKGCGVEVKLHEAPTFDAADAMIDDPSRRFDLILSDTFRGAHKNHDVAVKAMIDKYQTGRFCPLIVFNASARPPELTPQAFVIWADKTEPQGIQKAVEQMLGTGVPQIARTLHDELDKQAGTYLWGFLNKNWGRLVAGRHVERDSLLRLIRRRAALQLAEITYTESGPKHIEEVSGHEVYVYPPLNEAHFSLGEVVRKKTDASDIRVILTPHCFLAIQANQTCPRADYVVTVKTVPVTKMASSLFEKAKKEQDANKRHGLIRRLITPPSHQDVGAPAGRYWYLPQFLDVPDLYCDFLQVESLAHSTLWDDYEDLAVLAPPFAESLQACFGAFHGSVGIPNVRPESVADGFLR